jgi:hypothetical protein
MSTDNIVERLKQLQENLLRLYGQTVELAQQAERAAVCGIGASSPDKLSTA